VIDDGLRFGPDFTFGTATAAYQIEGAATADGRGPSIWDTFSHLPGTIADGSTGDVACESYVRYAEDVRLAAGLGSTGYRFSVSWSRVQPTGSGPANPAGLDHYERLVDALLEAGVDPVLTLFHWDLPQALQDAGGWRSRDTAARLADYAGLVAERLGDRVRAWITLNEPVVHTMNGHVLGTHAPGLRLGWDALQVAHGQLLGHGLAVAALRAAGVRSVGITNNYSPCEPDSPGDADASALADVLWNRLFTDPVLLGSYPVEVPGATAAELATIAAPLDFLGVNYYFPSRIRADASAALGFMPAEWPDAPRTAFDWPVVPDGLTRTLTDLRDRYGDALPPIQITENGAAYDGLDDPERVSYLDGHLRAVRRAVDAGVDVRGYFCWSLIDNFEWAEGFTKRFGLVHVDPDTRDRTPKTSYAWYADVIAAQRE
jgi:beta-glucosidase